MLDYSKVISTGVGPIIVISACGLLCLALYNRMAAVVTRVRTFQRELLNEQFALRQIAPEARAELTAARHQHLIDMLQVQVQRISYRARLVRRALFCLLLAVLLMSLCALLLGLSVLLSSLVITAVVFFTLGIVAMATGIVFAMIELTHALDPMLLEASAVSQFGDVLRRLHPSEQTPRE